MRIQGDAPIFMPNDMILCIFLRSLLVTFEKNRKFEGKKAGKAELFQIREKLGRVSLLNFSSI